MSETYKLGDAPQTPDVSLNHFLLQLKVIVNSLNGVNNSKTRVITQEDLDKVVAAYEL